MGRTVETVDQWTTGGFSGWRNQEQEDFSGWRSQEQEDFENWMDAIRGVLGEDVAASLAQRIVALESYKQVTLPLSGWSADPPYTQIVEIAGMKETDRPIPLFVDDGTNETDSKAKKKAYGCITKFDSGEEQLTVTCKYKKPVSDFTIALKGV